MKQVKPPKHTDEDAELTEALAVLLSCTHTRKRPLSLTEIAKWLEVAVSKLGSFSAVAERIGVSTKMLRQFSNVRQLTNRVQRLFADRRLDSVDAATHLAKLPPKEQEQLALSLASGEIDTIDTRDVAQLRQKDKSASLSGALQRVKESKTKHEYVVEFVVRGADNSRNKLMVAFKKYIPEMEIVTLEVEGAFGRLVLTRKGKDALAKAAHDLRVPIKHVIPTILQGRT